MEKQNQQQQKTLCVTRKFACWSLTIYFVSGICFIEFCCKIQPWQTAVTQTSSRLLYIHDQYCTQQSRRGFSSKLATNLLKFKVILGVSNIVFKLEPKWIYWKAVLKGKRCNASREILFPGGFDENFSLLQDLCLLMH